MDHWFWFRLVLFNLVCVLPRLWPVRKRHCYCVLLECMIRARLRTKSVVGVASSPRARSAGCRQLRAAGARLSAVGLPPGWHLCSWPARLRAGLGSASPLHNPPLCCPPAGSRLLRAVQTSAQAAARASRIIRFCALKCLLINNNLPAIISNRRESR